MRVQNHVEEYASVFEEKIDRIVEMNQQNPYPPGTILMLTGSNLNRDERAELSDFLYSFLPTYDPLHRVRHRTRAKPYWIGSPAKSDPDLWLCILMILPTTVAPFSNDRVRYYSDPKQLKKALRSSIRRRSKNILQNFPSLNDCVKEFDALDHSINIVLENLRKLQNLPNILQEKGLRFYNQSEFAQISNTLRKIDEKFNSRHLNMDCCNHLCRIPLPKKQLNKTKELLQQEIKKGKFNDILEADISEIQQSVVIRNVLMYRISDIFAGEAKTCLTRMLDAIFFVEAGRYYYDSAHDLMVSIRTAVAYYQRCVDAFEFVYEVLEKTNLLSRIQDQIF